jgi:hypothetical protein
VKAIDRRLVFTSAFSGALAFALAKLGGVAGLESWRWIWLLEGAFTALTGLVAPFVFVDTPEKAGNWLTHEEKRYLVLRQRYGAGSGGVARSEAFTISLLGDLFKNWQTYPMILIYISHSVLGCESTCCDRFLFLSKRLTMYDTPDSLPRRYFFLTPTSYENPWVQQRKGQYPLKPISTHAATTDSHDPTGRHT